MKLINIFLTVWPLFWLWFFTRYILQADAEPLLFEKVGTMASSLSYLHTQIPINLSTLEDSILSFKQILTTEFTEERLWAQLVKYYQANNLVTPARNRFHIHPMYQWTNIARAQLAEVDTLLDDLDALLLILPSPPNKTEIYYNPEVHEFFKHINEIARAQNPIRNTSIPYRDRISRDTTNQTLKRPKRFVPILIGIAGLLIPGMMGTIMGILNKQKIEALYQEVKTNSDNIQKLFAISDQQTASINAIIEQLHNVAQDLQDQSIFEGSVFLAKTSKNIAEIRNRVHKITHAIQQAQHRRLAVDYLSSKELSKLFHDLRIKADLYDCELVVSAPSDLFQLEVSYFFDGAVLTILLHTPMTPKDALLRIYKLHPFPLPFFGDTFLIPDVRNDVLAISNTDQRYSMQLSSADLLGCLKINHIYLCERNGVLAKSYTDTCLGSLYSQQYEMARKLCSFIVQPAQEFFYQLQQNWFLAYFPTKQILPISCRNGTRNEMHFKASVTKFHLSPGCTLESNQYKLVSDLSITIPADYIHLEMDWDPMQFFPHPPSEVIPELDKLKKLNVTRMSLTDLRHSLTVTKLPYNFFHNIHFGFNIITVSLFVFMVLICLYRCRANHLERIQAKTLETPVSVHYHKGTGVDSIDVLQPLKT